MRHSADLTDLLVAWSAGDETARNRLIDAVYNELRRLARGYLRRERADHSLAPTALVHEAYLKLIVDGLAGTLLVEKPTPFDSPNARDMNMG